MTQPTRRCLLALVATLACSPPGHDASANGRDLLVSPVPAASCAAEGGDGAWTHGAFVLGGRLPPESGDLRPRGQWLRCPLPVDNAAVSDRRPDEDDDITSFRVLYHDADGRGAGTFVQVALYQTTLLPSGTLQSRPVCLWNSNTNGTGATGPAHATAACAHDIAVGAFYHFEVQLHTNAVGPDQIFAEFVGITFPQR